jgi:hypothetical protein
LALRARRLTLAVLLTLWGFSSGAPFFYMKWLAELSRCTGKLRYFKKLSLRALFFVYNVYGVQSPRG